MTTATKREPVTKGHRCLGVSQWVEVVCECGWKSDMLRLKETKATYAQWRKHRDDQHGGEK